MKGRQHCSKWHDCHYWMITLTDHENGYISLTTPCNRLIELVFDHNTQVKFSSDHYAFYGSQFMLLFTLISKRMDLFFLYFAVKAFQSCYEKNWCVIGTIRQC
jgi:hypothetical protein